MNVEQQFLVGPNETTTTELEKVVEVISGKPEDPGFLQPAHKRVALVVAELERTIATQRATLEAIGRAEGVPMHPLIQLVIVHLWPMFVMPFVAAIMGKQ